MTMQCICQICNCGKHRCPEEPGLLAGEDHPPDPISEYKEKFIAHVNAEVRSAIRVQDEYHPPAGKMSSMTTFRLDYVPHPVIPREPRVQCAYVPPEGPMTMTTTYSEDFHRHAVQYHRVSRVDDYHPSMAKMDTLSTYKDEFRTWPPQRRQPHRVTDNLTLNAGKFCGTSTFKDCFRPVVGMVTRQPCKPPASSLEPRERVPFNGVTNYRLQYAPPPVEALQRPSSAPLRGSSTQRLQQDRVPPTVRWNTESREKFQAWPLGARQPQHQADAYEAPAGHMTFDSTTHADYVQHGCPPPGRPVIQAWADAKEKDAQQGTHRGRPVERRSLGKPTATATTTTTTYRSQFTPKTAPKPVRLQHAPGMRRSAPAHPAEGAGGSHPEVPTCPASYAHPPGFQDTRMTCGGHRLYRTISQGEGGGTAPAKEAKEVATVTSGQSPRGHSVGRKSVVVDGRGRGQH
ncbi:stabilizer of axonemal microtubules 1-like [Sardina pilchardus]|uniref:stabilizer of axonemal microtubules 1-like n=1 Tax=Sardina pilchardus TaxID=27697 RepID=UPI002E167E2B